MTIAQRITDTYAGTLEVIDFIVSRTSDSLADILTKALPLVAPIPNAVSIYYVSQSALSYNNIQALAVAASIECMFFALTEVVLKSWELWHTDKQYKLPLVVSVGAFFVYFGLVMTLVYMLEVSAGHSIAPMAFPVVSVVAAVALGVTRWHKRTSTHIAVSDSQQEMSGKVSVTERKPVPVTVTVDTVSDSQQEMSGKVSVTECKPVIAPVSVDTVSDSQQEMSGKVSVTERRNRLSQLLTSVSATADVVSEWSKEFGASERTIWRDIQMLSASGD